MRQSWWNVLTYFEVLTAMAAAAAALVVFFLRSGALAASGRAPADDRRFRQNVPWLIFAVICFIVLPALPAMNYYVSIWVNDGLHALTGLVHRPGSFDSGFSSSGAEWTLDRAVNVEGLATAAAACGAATAYVVDLVRRRREERTGAKRNAQAKAIVEVLQRNWAEGASEEEVIRILTSDDQDAVEIRKAHGALRRKNDPSTHRRIESALLGLVYEGIIRMSKPDHYRLRDAPSWDDEIDYARREDLRVALRDELREAIWATITRHPKGYELASLMGALEKLGERFTPNRLLEIRDSYPAEEQKEVLEGLVRFLTRK